MIYEEGDLYKKRSKGFFYFCDFYTKSFIALREGRKRRKVLKKPTSPVQQTRPARERETSQFRDRKYDYWSTLWGILIRKLGCSNHGAGPCITSRDGKLFRRRFRVPWPVYCDLVKKCREKLVFGPNSLDDFSITGWQFTLPN